MVYRLKIYSYQGRSHKIENPIYDFDSLCFKVILIDTLS